MVYIGWIIVLTSCPANRGRVKDYQRLYENVQHYTKVKMLKRISFGLRNVEVYVRKVMLGFLPQKVFHTI